MQDHHEILSNLTSAFSPEEIREIFTCAEILHKDVKSFLMNLKEDITIVFFYDILHASICDSLQGDEAKNFNATLKRIIHVGGKAFALGVRNIVKQYLPRFEETLKGYSISTIYATTTLLCYAAMVTGQGGFSTTILTTINTLKEG